MSNLILDLVRSRVPADKFKHISMAKGGEWCSPCPVCGGDDRFRVWPDQNGGDLAMKAGVPGTWWCRQCDKTGDVISLLMFADGLEFSAACRELRIELSESGRRLKPLHAPKQEQAWTPTEWDVPAEIWRKQATKLALEAHEQLLNFSRGLEYLADRGLPLEAARQYKLGFLQAEDKKTGTCLYRARSAFGLPDRANADGSKTRRVLWIPRGFTIPLWSPSWDSPAETLRVRIRRPKGDLKEGDSKYMLLTGSGQAPMVLSPVGIAPALAVWVVVEAELDAIAVHHACRGKVGVLAVLTNRGKPDVQAHKLLAASPLILVALDFDKPDGKGNRPGYQGWVWWREHYGQAKRWPVPEGKDPGDTFKAGIDLSEWIGAALPEALSLDLTGTLGAASFGRQAMGEGEKPAVQPVTAKPAARELEPQQQRGPCRWPHAGADTPLSEVRLPSECPSLTYLRRAMAGREVTDDLLVTCPKAAHPWWWTEHKHCLKCSGHRLCFVDFLTSPQMRAPLSHQEPTPLANLPRFESSEALQRPGGTETFHAFAH